jgi:hypothetical protein
LCVPGGCSGGDGISDTAPERSPAYDCVLTRDTCSGGGFDPVQNYMDYTDDECLSNFTLMQKSSMVANWIQYRNTGNNPAPVTPPVPQPVASPVGTMMMMMLMRREKSDAQKKNSKEPTKAAMQDTLTAEYLAEKGNRKRF